MFSELDRKLCQALCDHPRSNKYRFTEKAHGDLLETLFRSLTNDRADYLSALFPSGFPKSYKLQDAQGAEERTEYTEAARGHPCGHIFQHGEASYHCMTCADDATCVLCARCFDSSDHEGHQFHISPSAGNSGCCDCGDAEAWKRPVNCAIHSATDSSTENGSYVSVLPTDLEESIRTTISRVLDYFCDVISCSPENLRVPKTTETIKHDENYSRLWEKYSCNGSDADDDPEYCLVLWNDEKHTVNEVKMQVSRACRERLNFGERKANEAHHYGRSVVKHSRNLEELIRQAKVIEQIKLTVTIRSSRDTYREQMCGAIVEWLSDIAGCSISGDNYILRRVICEEMLQQWRVGSEAYYAEVGRDGIDTHGNSEALRLQRLRQSGGIMATWHEAALAAGIQAGTIIIDDAEDEAAETEAETPGETGATGQQQDDEMTDALQQDAAELDRPLQTTNFVYGNLQPDVEMNGGPAERDEHGEEPDTDGDAEFIDVHEYMTGEVADAPPPPPPPPQGTMVTGDAFMSPTESEAGDTIFLPDERSRNFQNIPKTPHQAPKRPQQPSPSHWAILPPGYSIHRTDVPAYEDFSRNIRLDSLILFDLRLWKQTRVELRDLYISTVVNIPKFKRILGLRFSGLYTTLSQLYLVADREPDHSIMNLSLQMLTTPSITKEVIERGNFLTNLMAILYTFLTTRQVGYPKDVDPQATLAFDTGSVTNRRLIHFFTDLRWYLASTFVQERVRIDKQYLMQYLDLAKLAQGICPNVRAVGEHVEYETDTWIHASVLTREINKLCRQFAEAFHSTEGKAKSSLDSTGMAIFNTTCVTVINSIGLECKRFEQNEIKEPISGWKTLEPFDFETQLYGSETYHNVIDFEVENSAVSFHHPLHYTLSWLLEFGNNSDLGIEALVEGARQTVESLSDSQLRGVFQSSEDALLALFDYPLRVCAWLAQMKAGVWVRNGLSLRHQMFQYTNVSYRDVGHHRDLVLLQTALVACSPAHVLASMIDRFGLDQWMRADFQSMSDYEDLQVIDLVEDFITLLISLLLDRDSLIPFDQDPHPHIHAIRKSIIHTLCFKPLTFSDLTARLTERVQDQEQFQEVLDTLTTYRPPEGLHDSGLFELRPEFLSELDPYNPHFSKNQRDEAETLYRNYRSKQTGKPADDVVLEPSLRPIEAGAFVSLAAVSQTPLFAQVIFACLLYAQQVNSESTIPATRVEAFLHVVLQLALVATVEDKSDEGESQGQQSFVHNAINLTLPRGNADRMTCLKALHKLSGMDAYTSCRGKIKNLLKHFVRKREDNFNRASADLDFPFGRLDTASPAIADGMEAKKKQALERKARVMAQFQQQQQSFMNQQGMLDWDDDDDEALEDCVPTSTEVRVWKAPSGVCIHCREETNDTRLYGTFGMMVDGQTLRQTDICDPDFVREALDVPASLDKSIPGGQPFGVSGANHEQVQRLTSEGEQIVIDRQGLGKGWPHGFTQHGLVSTSCGHIMHFTCFETYYASVARRQSHQIARNHPERLSQKEFVCPLCKAMGNTFLPIICRSVEQSYPSSLASVRSLDLFLDIELPLLQSEDHDAFQFDSDLDNSHSRVLSDMANGPLASTAVQISTALRSQDLPLSPATYAPSVGADRSPLGELLSILSRLGSTLHIAKGVKPSSQSIPSTHAVGYRALLRVLADTITATEIAHRRHDSDHGATLLSSISAQTLSHLQIISTTIETFAAVDSFIPKIERNGVNSEAKLQMFAELFPTPDDDPKRYATQIQPILRNDAFTTLTECSYVLSRLGRPNLHHVLRLCYTAEILRVIISYFTTPHALLAALDASGSDATNVEHLGLPRQSDKNALMWTLGWVEQKIPPAAAGNGIPERALSSSGMNEHQLGAFYRVIKAYALAFLRKAVILMHTSHRTDFPPLSVQEAEQSELIRLSHLLRLPDIQDILRELSSYSSNPGLSRLATNWITHLSLAMWNVPITSIVACSPFGIKLLHPAPLELIGLPKHFDVLMEESHRRRCPTTGKEITDPALCLFCGEIFCAQASCCTQDGQRGGCNMHVEKCSYPIGMFLIIRKCHILLLHVAPAQKTVGGGHEDTRSSLIRPSTLSHGSFFAAPYLTKHGETDSGLRSRYQLILNQNRYDRLLRDAWLMVNPSSTIWSAIARKLEGDVNAGGWGTL